MRKPHISLATSALLLALSAAPAASAGSTVQVGRRSENDTYNDLFGSQVPFRHDVVKKDRRGGLTGKQFQKEQKRKRSQPLFADVDDWSEEQKAAARRILNNFNKIVKKDLDKVAMVDVTAKCLADGAASCLLQSPRFYDYLPDPELWKAAFQELMSKREALDAPTPSV